MRLELELEPLNHTYDEEKAVQAIQTALEEFYKSLTKKLENISVKKILKKKNPYLYRAKGIQDAARIVDSILSAYISSSEETIFGNAFFEPLAALVHGYASMIANNAMKYDPDAIRKALITIAEGLERGENQNDETL